MNCPNIVIIHKEQPIRVSGPAGGAEMATRWLGSYLAKSGKQVVLAGLLSDPEQIHEGVTYWSYGSAYDIDGIIERASRRFANFHLIATGRAIPLLFARRYPQVGAKILISHDRSAGDAGVSLSVVSAVADKILSVSEAHRAELINAGGSSGKIEVIYNGVDFDTFTVGSPEHRDWRKIVFAGALVQDKGLHLLLQAYANLKPVYPEISLDIYGSADLWGRAPIFDTALLESQLPGVKFFGAVPQSQLAAGFRAAGICVFPSIWFETFGLSSVEAQASGCPVVAFNVGGVREGMIPGESGILVDEISVDALTAALKYLLSDPVLLQRMSVRAAAHVRERFSWEMVAQRVIRACDAAVIGRN